jgi:hypothetical protein
MLFALLLWGMPRGRSTMFKRIALALLLLGTVMATAGISLAPTAALADPRIPVNAASDCQGKEISLRSVEQPEEGRL